MSRAGRSLPWLAGAAALAFLAASAPATTLIALNDDQLIDQSTLIVTGSCAKVRHEWRQGMLLTLATIRVDRVLKGKAGSEVTLMIPGGIDFERKVPVAVTFPGAPTVLPDERVLLFLEPAGTGPGEMAVTGFSQGKLSILEAADGTPMVRRDLAGVSLAKGHRLQAGGKRAMPLALMEERIARRIGPRGGREKDGN
jgi:hypothetical protein